jgi:hypothetical protein
MFGLWISEKETIFSSVKPMPCMSSTHALWDPVIVGFGAVY